MYWEVRQEWPWMVGKHLCPYHYYFASFCHLIASRIYTAGAQDTSWLCVCLKCVLGGCRLVLHVLRMVIEFWRLFIFDLLIIPFTFCKSLLLRNTLQIYHNCAQLVHKWILMTFVVTAFPSLIWGFGPEGFSCLRVSCWRAWKGHILNDL